jgi:hypothetical protein
MKLLNKQFKIQGNDNDIYDIVKILNNDQVLLGWINYENGPMSTQSWSKTDLIDKINDGEWYFNNNKINLWRHLL